MERPLRVAVFTSADPEIVLPLVERFDRELGIEVAGVFFEHFRRRPSARLKRFFRQHGAAGVAGKVLRAAAAPLRAVSPARWMNRWAHPERPGADAELREFTARRSIPVHHVASFHSGQTLDLLRSSAPDVGIVYGTRILREKFFAIPRLGSLNIHSRKVPEYRGGGPIGFHEMLRGELEIGVTIHQVASDLDAGDVWARATLPIEERDVPESLALKVRMIGRDLFVEALRKIARGERPVPQGALGKPGMFRSPDRRARRAFRRRFADRYRNPRREGLRDVARTALAAVYLYCGWVQVRNALRRRRGRVPGVIVNFHRVADNRAEHWMTIGTAMFDRYIRFLKRYYRIVSIEEMRRILASGRNSEHIVAITFDDGYRECATAAAAVLENHRVPGAFYVCSGFLESESDLEHDRERGIVGLPKMRSENLRDLIRRGFEIGSHSVTHADFRYASVEEIEREIAQSKSDIERATGQMITGLSVPFGSVDHCRPDVFAVARRVGCGYVLSHFDGANFPDGAPFHLRRVRPVLGDILSLHAAVEGWRGASALLRPTGAQEPDLVAYETAQDQR